MMIFIPLRDVEKERRREKKGQRNTRKRQTNRERDNIVSEPHLHFQRRYMSTSFHSFRMLRTFRKTVNSMKLFLDCLYYHVNMFFKKSSTEIH